VETPSLAFMVLVPVVDTHDLKSLMQ